MSIPEKPINCDNGAVCKDRSRPSASSAGFGTQHQVNEPANNFAPQRLSSMSFVGYLLMTLLTAINDSLFRWLVVPIAREQSIRQFGWSERDAESLVTSLGLGAFMLPFVVFAPWAGWMSDRFSKRSSIIWLKLAEVLLVALGILSISFGNITLMFLILFLIGAQATLIGTAKLGIIPEIVRRTDISAANGWSGLATLVGAIVGTVAGYALADVTLRDRQHGLLLSAVALIGTAVVGTVGAWLTQHVRAASPAVRFQWNLVADSWRDIRIILRDRAILRVTLGVIFFWSLAAMAQMTIDAFVRKELADNLVKANPSPFMALLVLGVGAGSLLAGWWSSGRVELGMVPFGALLMGIACILLYYSSDSPTLTGVLLVFIGLGGGLFNVPLQAWLQERVPHTQLGAVLAACQQLTAIGMLLVSGLFWLMRGPLQLSGAQIFLISGLMIIPIVVYAVCILPQATIRFFVWLLSRFVYRVRTYGIDNIPEQGPGLLVANHVSWIDGVLILLASSRPIRMLAYADYVEGRFLGSLAKLFGIIPIRSGDGPRALIRSLSTAASALQNGELVCIFAEGAITRTGQLMKFERGLLRILRDAPAPIIPVCLDELWGSVFSYEGGRFLWKKPRHWPYPVSISFGSPITGVQDVDLVRSAVLELHAQSLLLRKERSMIPALRLIRQCRLSWKRPKVSDSSGASLTGGRLLMAALAFRRLLSQRVLQRGTPHVGVLVPPSVGGVLANTSLALAGRVAVNLNYTLSDELLNYCIREAGIRQVITSRAFVEKKPVQLNAELVFLEDLKQQISGMDKAIAFIQGALTPLRLLSRILQLHRVRADDLLTIIFTSGSTGEPKGVMLSQNNIASNLDAVNQLLRLRTEDVLLGVLPFFHSFGYTVTMWLPLCTEPAGVYHFNPLDARTVGTLTQKHSCTIIAATPTFLRNYLKRCTVEEMKTMNLVIVGAEKMPDDLRDAFREKFGFEPIEGYGTTEMSPVASFNVPPSRMDSAADPASGLRHGTVGRAIPGVAAAVFNPDTGAKLGANQEGLLKIKGPNIMLGYLNQPGKTAELMTDGWYNSGDMAVIDDDGFIRITGRMSRFSKIGGEMVPHILVEQEIAKVLEEDAGEDGGIQCAVTSVADPRKGERLVVLHKPMRKTVREITDRLQAAGLPNLFIPSAEGFVEVDQIPLLGTGKLDLRGIKQLAEQKMKDRG
ncbi:MAG: Bifunctional protein aas [Planctomycetota bacterium]|jgi:acyl-[acyl-carrier-protein]-phospholipid O-acyltransferase/long-chain-fatty-acid--[acyl-carrier-protein] ligase